MKSDRNNLCAELFSIENELEFRKEHNLTVDDLIKKQKDINRKLSGLRKHDSDTN